ncbi:MAG: DUF721 domain-containing protein [Patescibacteria group bacterium]
MRSLSDILNNHFKNSPLKRNVEASIVVEEANRIIAELLGQDAIKYAQAVYVKNQILTIACLSSVIAQEIKLNEPVILAKIKEKAGERAVLKIRYLS